jgi:hypothetical protein
MPIYCSRACSVLGEVILLTATTRSCVVATPKASTRWPKSFTSMSADLGTRPDLSLSLMQRSTVDEKIFASLVRVGVFSLVVGLLLHGNVRGGMTQLSRFIRRLAGMVEGEVN